MKRCPECRRDYTDETLKFCLDDGTPLVDGPASMHEPATAIFASEHPTQAHSSEESKPAASGNVGARNKLLFGVVGILLAAAIGFGGFWLFGSRTGKQINSIAVMPFVNESGNPDVEYLSDGMTDSLINSLTNLPNVSVKARNTVFRYKGTNIDERKVGQELSVQALLLGRFTQHGDNVTLHISLIDAQTGTTIWGEQYDRRIQDIAALHKDIVFDVARKLRDRLSVAEARNLTRNYTDNPEAFQLYQKGRFFWNKRNPDSIKKAIEYFEQAIKKDPGFPLAYSGLADAYVVPANRLEPRVAMPEAKTAALQALALDETLAEAHVSLARVLQVWEWDWAGAEKEYKRAIELNPRYSLAHQWYGGWLERTGLMEGAISERKLAVDLDPLSASVIFELGLNYFVARDYDQAIAQFQKSLELDPAFTPAYQYLPFAYTEKGMFEEALAALREAPESAGIDKTGVPGYVYAFAGRTSEARKELERLKELRKTEYIPATSLAHVCVALGEKDETLLWLEKAVEERAFQTQLLKVDPRWDPIRDDPRFRDLLKKVGFPA